MQTDVKWNASWIGVQNPSSANQWICYRKSVQLTSAPSQAVARISADSKYWLWINGKLVVFEGQLKRGPTPDGTYYDQVDLADYLEKGHNTIVILLWYFGKHGFSHKSSGKAGLVFEADMDGNKLFSNRDWKAVIHLSFGNTHKPHPNYRLPESNIRFDATKEPVGWQDPKFDDSAWPAAVEFGMPPCAPWNRLVLRLIPQWKDFGLREYVNAKELPRISDGTVIKARLPYNAQVTPYLKIEAQAGRTIDIRMDNYRCGGPPNVRAEYVTREGIQEYENPGWMSGHEVHYTIPEDVKILDLKYRETGYNTEFTGTFECDDPFLNKLRQKALRTLYVTMRDTYYDCPDRERAQWWGDMVNELSQAFYAMDTRSSLLAKKGMLELINWQKKNNTIFSPVPAGNWNKELPMQMLAGVGYYGFWTYCNYSGDVETINTVYPGVKRYLSLWKLGDDGLVIPRKGGWTWCDWGKNKDITILYNGWYYIALKGQKKMAELLGLEEDIKEIRAKMASIENNFNKTFWNGTAYRSPGYKGQTDDRGQALAVVSGLAGPDKYNAIRQVFRKEFNASIYMEKYVLEALYIMRFENDVMERIRRQYGKMVADPCTTLWEQWGGGSSRNHGWSGWPLTLMSQYALGVAPEEVGYDVYHVLPQMGPLTHIRATVPSVKGDIKVELRDEREVFSLHLESPPKTAAIIGIPRNRNAKVVDIQVRRSLVWHAGKPRQTVHGMKFLENTRHYVKFSVMPGKWTFTAKKEIPKSMNTDSDTRR